MPALAVSIDYDALEAHCEQLLERIEPAASEALRFAAETLAGEARRVHGYRNRTGTLEASTYAMGPEGSLYDGDLHAWATAETEYASYVESRFSFMQIAYQKKAAEIDRGIAAILEAATR